MTPVDRFAVLPITALGMSITLAAGCGGTAPPPSPPPTAESVPATSAPPPAPTPPAAATTEATPEPPKETPETKAPAAASPGGRNIVYRMTSSGLVIDLEGIQLEPKAEPVKLGGGWGVKVVVRAKVTDDREHHLQNPTQGPLMVAVEIDRDGKKELVPDQRQGDGELTLSKSSAPPIEREFRKAIVSGQSLTLYVGLWGLGDDAGDRKPIKKLFVVRMVAGSHKPQPVVSAPE